MIHVVARWTMVRCVAAARRTCTLEFDTISTPAKRWNLYSRFFVHSLSDSSFFVLKSTTFIFFPLIFCSQSDGYSILSVLPLLCCQYPTGHYYYYYYYYYYYTRLTSSRFDILACDGRMDGWTDRHCYYYYTTLHPFSSLFSRTTWVSQYHKGKTRLGLNVARDDGVLGWQWHQLDHMQTICTLLQTDNHANTLSLNFYGLDALPDSQPTVSMHRRPSDKWSIICGI